MAQDGNPRRVSLVLPIILITIGVLFLLHNWRPAFDPWSVLRDFWPLILVFVGLGMIWDNYQRRRHPNAPAGISVGSTIGILAFVFVLAVLLWHGRGLSRRHRLYSESRRTTQIVNLQGAKSARVKLEMGAGQLNIDGGPRIHSTRISLSVILLTSRVSITTSPMAWDKSIFPRTPVQSTSVIREMNGICISPGTFPWSCAWIWEQGRET